MSKTINIKYLETLKKEFIDNCIFDSDVEDDEYRKMLLYYYEKRKGLQKEYKELLITSGFDFTDDSYAEVSTGYLDVIANNDDQSKIIATYPEKIDVADKKRIITYNADMHFRYNNTNRLLSFEKLGIRHLLINNPLGINYIKSLFNDGIIDSLTLGSYVYLRDSKKNSKINHFESLTVDTPYDFFGIFEEKTDEKGIISIKRYTRK